MIFLLETFKVIGLLFYYLLESFVFSIVPKRKKSVSGEIVLITGAGSGIGRLLSLKFASLGSTVVLWDINEEGLKETSKLVRKNGAVRVHSYLCDCSKRQDIYRVADQVKKEVGDVTILINNAGIVIGKSFLESPDSLVEKTMEVNTMAHFWTYKAFLPAMMASNHGHLVSIASAAGLVGVNRLSDYCASKYAAVGFAESVDLELKDLGRNGVKTTIVCPFVINTGMFDGCESKWPTLLPVLEPEYVAEKIMTAIRRDQEILALPRSVYFLIALKHIFPVKVGVLFMDYVGVFRLMDTFRGRAKKA
ncbi:RDHE2 dehydrogenase, partial [Psilopogon haemacephalus]|nr:RDHE2 dehydrogenase [Psilopogon haemacephalus]